MNPSECRFSGQGSSVRFFVSCWKETLPFNLLTRSWHSEAWHCAGYLYSLLRQINPLTATVARVYTLPGIYFLPSVCWCRYCGVHGRKHLLGMERRLDEVMPKICSMCAAHMEKARQFLAVPAQRVNSLRNLIVSSRVRVRVPLFNVAMKTGLVDVTWNMMGWVIGVCSECVYLWVCIKFLWSVFIVLQGSYFPQGVHLLLPAGEMSSTANLKKTGRVRQWCTSYNEKFSDYTHSYLFL